VNGFHLLQCCIFIKTLVESQSAEVLDLLNKYSVTFIPLANPDGYEYSRSTARVWRKNRVPNSDGSFGVDLNRNFDDHWGLACSAEPSSSTYCGEAAFSEIETRAIRDYVVQKGPFYGTIDFGSYGQRIVLPYGWTASPPQRQPVLKVVADAWSNDITSVNRAKHTVEQGYKMFNSSGNFRDWTFSKADVEWSYSVLVRDLSTYGFLVPSSQILKTGQENYVGFLSYLRSISTYIDA